MSVGKQFFPDTWDKVCQCVRDIYLSSVPHQLISWKPDDTMMSRYVRTYVRMQAGPCRCPNVHIIFLYCRSYSTLSVGSTRSSLTFDLHEKTPSVISTSEQAVATDLSLDEQGGIGLSSPGVTEAAQVQISIHSAEEDIQNGGMDASAGEGVTAVEVEDEELGKFVSVSNISSESKITGDVVSLVSTASATTTVEAGTLTESNSTTPEPGTTAEPDPSTQHPNHSTGEEYDGSTDIHQASSAALALSDSNVLRSSSPAAVEMEHSLHGNNLADSYLRPAQAKETRVTGNATNQSPEISLKKNASKTERTGRKVSRKEAQRNKEKAKKSKESADKFIDDNQSEMSYQPDTDLSRSKASKKVNGK